MTISIIKMVQKKALHAAPCLKVSCGHVMGLVTTEP